MLSKFQGNVRKAMEDDFNTPQAIASLFELIREVNAKKAYTKEALDFLKEIDEYFSFIFWGKQKQKKIPAEILKLAKLREQARKQKNWSKADQLRDRLSQRGWSIDDHPSGPHLKKV